MTETDRAAGMLDECMECILGGAGVACRKGA